MKKFTKTITSIALLLAITLSLTSASFAYTDMPSYYKAQGDRDKIEFSDVPSTHWAYETIGNAYAKRLINGYEDGTFRPDNQMTKLEFLTVVADWLTLWSGYTNKRTYTCRGDSETTSFMKQYNPPISNWATSAIRIAFRTYLINENDAEFTNLNEPITRGDIVKILSRCEIGRKMMRENKNDSHTVMRAGEKYMAKLRAESKEIVEQKENAMINADTSEISKRIADWNTIPKTHQGYVANVYEKGIVNGYDDGTFGADKTVTRAEAATMLLKFKEYVNAPGVQDR